ncbi:MULTISPECIES: Mrp/NBP35 family ATP-binding protein [Sphingobacterium]|jgi:ATP-binding protein involved in chromosome partitioning|uniref:Mrp/NBP35 family ATP-binding protein n=4 Tax=Sphingobacterium TaxID=28453 RepID=A0ACD5BXZ0_9SPHI|nr:MULTISPECIES: Mrp/NBP35 family ATP-binding protein [Sphingobacterium]HAE69236.1 iron-sulfur cluster carrier protein ApbC [Sphingobacterium sp.]KKO91262.1 ATP-binding protein [Sphingobacterium sp. Ag1]OFV20376.1 ATP-binding protein [Sphingobacterium sp. HMSC13C05]OJZ10688.1 MAG: MRP family ATP-binding protein [Sphingobacterium sp. 40-24]QQT43031.1 Mrp/NBP35 family ATP-binding protein [Sphingobacterium multivorum]
MVTKEQVLNALSYVEEPDLKKDLVTLNMIQNIEIEGQKISFDVILTTPACPLKDHIEHACRNAIAHFIDKNLEVQINMTSNVIGKQGAQVSGIKNIILVSSGKGGVGKSTVAANLALALHAKGAKTGLLDADIYGPSLPIMFGLEGAKPGSVEMPDGQVKIEPLEKFGLKLLSIGFFTDPNQPIPWRGPMTTSAIKQLFNDAHWGELDYLVVDMPPGTGDIHITVSQTFPIAGAVIVTTPQHVALADAVKGIGMFLMDSINIPLLGVVENMAYFTPAELPENKYYIFGKDGGKRLAEEYKVPFLGEIPLLKGISDAGDNGFPVAIDTEDPVTKSFLTIAEKVAQQLSIIHSQGK